jgi:hypothetical protein
MIPGAEVPLNSIAQMSVLPATHSCSSARALELYPPDGEEAGQPPQEHVPPSLRPHQNPFWLHQNRHYSSPASGLSLSLCTIVHSALVH